MLDRPRHEEKVAEIREVGARIRFITDGDVSAALFAVTADAGVDLLWGIGGTPEGVLSAAAIKCLGGQILGRLWPRDDDERQAAIDAGYDLDEVLDVDRPRRRRRRLLRRHRRHRRRPAAGRALPQRRQGDDRVAGDALALGHGAQGQRPPRPGEAARGHRRPLRVGSAGAEQPRPGRRRDRLHRRPARPRAARRRRRRCAASPATRRRRGDLERIGCEVVAGDVLEPETLAGGARGRRGRLLPRPLDGPGRRRATSPSATRDGARATSPPRPRRPGSSGSSTSAGSASRLRAPAQPPRDRRVLARVGRPAHLLPRRRGDRRRQRVVPRPSTTWSSACRRWSRRAGSTTQTQPIAIADVVALPARRARDAGRRAGREIEIGGPEVTTYGGMMDAMAAGARAAARRRGSRCRC